ncbi:hypothetical protein [Mycobacterium kansasii]|uniref:hypothetical protein n=1 Tax=Mycobacterium kansasii TaxID=1768 RepID=UPI0021561520|nr:hypothetical protein [Mycobacterium kansasii]
MFDQRHQSRELVGGVALTGFEDGDDPLAEQQRIGRLIHHGREALRCFASKDYGRLV